MVIFDVSKAIFAGAFLLFLPGFVWSHAIFPRKEIDWAERVALSFGLSIAIVPLTVFWLNWMFGIKITLISSGLTVALLTLIPATYILVRRPDLRSEIRQMLSSFARGRKAWHASRNGKQ